MASPGSHVRARARVTKVKADSLRYSPFPSGVLLTQRICETSTYLVMRFAGQHHSTKNPGRTLARIPNSIPAHTHVSSVPMRKMVGLLHLPPELHDMILQSAGFRELVALEYTSRYFAALCRRYWKTTKPSKKDLCWAARRGK